MNTTQQDKRGYARLMSLFLGLCFLVGSADLAFAEHRRGNPPGAMGGPGAGPRWKDNPNRIDNPPGPLGGRGTDWGNPPGAMGGPGAGPRWKDNPNKIDNPPGPIGGRGTDWYNRPYHPRQLKYRVATHRLEKLKAKRERLAAKGAPADQLAKLDERIAEKQTKIDEFLSKHNPKQESESPEPAVTQDAQQ